MKNFFGKNGELLFILLVVVVIMATLIFYLMSGNLPTETVTPTPETTPNNGQPITEQEPTPDPNVQVTLNDGRIIKIGDQLEMIAPTYYEGMNTIAGTVTSMHPEQKRVLLWVPDGVVEVPYRYVIEMKATKIVNSSDGNTEEPFSDTVRGVVTRNDQGVEIIHFLQDIDNPTWAGQYRAVQFDDLTTYGTIKRYNVTIDPTNVPPNILQFYRDNAPDITA